MKHITQTDLQQMYAPMPEHFAARMDGLLSSMPAGEEKIVVKKKISAALVLAVMLVMLTVGAVAAAMNWDAIRHLYGGEKPEMESLLVPVNKSAEAGGVRLEIATALTDGRTLVMDWSLQAGEEQLPVFITTEQLTVNGVKQWPNWGGGLQYLWLRKGETLRRGGDIFPLGKTLQAGENIHVELEVRVSKPKEEVVIFDIPEEEAQAAALREKGIWAVAPMGRAMTYRFDQNNDITGDTLAWNDYNQDGLNDSCFTHSRMTLCFDVIVPETTKQPLYPSHTMVEMEACTVELVEAVRTPLGIYTTLEAVSKVQTDEDDLAVVRILNGYEGSLRGEDGKFPFEAWGYIPEDIFQGEDGKLHKKIHTSFIGYWEAPFMEDAPLALEILEKKFIDEKSIIRLETVGEIKLRFEKPNE